MSSERTLLMMFLRKKRRDKMIEKPIDPPEDWERSAWELIEDRVKEREFRDDNERDD